MTGFEIFAVIMAVVAAAGGAYASISASAAQKKSSRAQADYQKQQSEILAKQARREAEWADYRIQIAEQEAEAKKRETIRSASETMAKARLRKGISSDSGSLLADEVNNIGELGYQLDMIDWNTSIETTNIRNQKYGYQYQANIADSQGEYALLKGESGARNAEQQGYMAAGSSLLAGGAKSVATYNYYNKGYTPSRPE